MSSDNKKNKINSNKSFGYVFFFVFLIIAIWPLFKGNEIRIWAISTPLNKIWNKFGILLCTIVSPIVMAAVFFIVVTPIGYIMRLLKKDLLKILYSNKISYWIKRNKNITSMRKQF